MYVVDGFSKLECSIKSYVDDAELYNSFQVGNYSHALVEALDYITKCASIWQLQISNSNVLRIISTVTASTHDHQVNDYNLQW